MTSPLGVVGDLCSLLIFYQRAFEYEQVLKRLKQAKPKQTTLSRPMVIHSQDFPNIQTLFVPNSLRLNKTRGAKHMIESQRLQEPIFHNYD